MTGVKIQHYVPRLYLKNFSIQKGKEYVIFCFDKTDLRQFQVNIKNIGCEKYFQNQSLENELNKLETEFNNVYKKLIVSRSLLCLSWKEKETLATFVAVQDLRTREQREVIRSLGKEVKKWLSDKPLSKDLEEQVMTADTEETARSIHLKLVAETLSGKNKLPEIILGMKWMLFENNTKVPLWTSDHPINRFNPIDQSPFGNLGLESEGIQVFFPLNPTLGIMFCDPVEYGLSPERVSCIKDHIIFCNTLQVMSSTRHVFSAKNDFFLAKKWLKENPEFTDLERKRIEPNK